MHPKPNLELNLRYVTVTMADAFNASRYTSGTQQLCDIIALILPRVPRRALSNLPAVPICGGQRVWLVSLFLQLLVGFSLPLYISYTFERHRKLCYLQELQQVHDSTTPDNAAANSTLPRHPFTTKGAAICRRLGTLIDRAHLGPLRQRGVTVGAAAAQWLLSLCFHAAMLSLLVALCWQLVIDLHPYIAMHVQLLCYPGADFKWYWELVCSVGDPRCPAA